MNFQEAMAQAPVVAIIRGVRNEEAVDIGHALVEAGVRLIETPLNSPNPIESIRLLVQALGDKAVVGAGTVLNTARVGEVADVGGQIIVSPNTDPEVIEASLRRGLIPLPGFGSPTEAFAALKAGAVNLKLFPASTYGLGHMKAIKEVLPAEAVLMPVGGVKPEQFAEWWAAGARGFGMGGDLYKAGRSPEDTHERARAAIAAIQPLIADPAVTGPGGG
jgi:2-dehydro-3-deoxyphosphogalactonate aldolase